MRVTSREAAFKDSEALDKLAHRIAGAVPDLVDAREANWKAFYSKSEPEHLGGKCRKLDGAVKHQTNLDYFILINLRAFTEMDDFHKFRIITHALFHILKEKGGFVVRRHAGDFCEIAEHDKFSYLLALKAMVALGIKYDKPEEVKKYAHIERLDLRSKEARALKDDWDEMDSLIAAMKSSVENADSVGLLKLSFKVGELLQSVENQKDERAETIRKKWREFGQWKVSQETANKLFKKPLIGADNNDS